MRRKEYKGLKRAYVASQSEKYFRHKTSSWRSCSIPRESFLVIRVYESYQKVEKLISSTAQRILHFGCIGMGQDRFRKKMCDITVEKGNDLLVGINLYEFSLHTRSDPLELLLFGVHPQTFYCIFTSILLQKLHKSEPCNFSSITREFSRLLTYKHCINIT